MEFNRKDIDITNEDFQRGVRFCIEELRRLSSRQKYKWSHSRNLNFAPVELSDYLLLRARDLKREIGSCPKL